jgi:hypothetical protein
MIVVVRIISIVVMSAVRADIFEELIGNFKIFTRQKYYYLLISKALLRTFLWF